MKKLSLSFVFSLCLVFSFQSPAIAGKKWDKFISVICCRSKKATADTSPVIHLNAQDFAEMLDHSAEQEAEKSEIVLPPAGDLIRVQRDQPITPLDIRNTTLDQMMLPGFVRPDEVKVNANSTEDISQNGIFSRGNVSVSFISETEDSASRNYR